jgi:hypothetical protein
MIFPLEGIPSCDQNLHARSLAQSPLAQFQSVHVVRQIDIGEHKVNHEFRLQASIASFAVAAS